MFDWNIKDVASNLVPMTVRRFVQTSNCSS